MKRVVLLIMDSVGVGSSDDATKFGDQGANTLGHIAEAFADEKTRTELGVPGCLRLPHMNRLGLGRACKASSGYFPDGLDPNADLIGGFAYGVEISSGKDTPSGHWEITGVPVLFDWTYFADHDNSFPPEILDAIVQQSDIPGYLGNCHASGTTIIAELGEEHMRSGKPIFYTSADSVFQIACHEETFGLERLFELCQLVRKILDPHNVGRVIARPFVGDGPDNFRRTGNRHDYSVPPPHPTVLQKLVEGGGRVFGIGKIGDIFAHTGISEEMRAAGHSALWKETLHAIARAPDRSIVMTNFVDFDAVYGHRRNVAGYGTALEEFDLMIPSLLESLQVGDLLIITADHGNDPTWHGTDHTREHIPIMLYGDAVVPGTDFGRRGTFADIGQTIAAYLGLEPMEYGTAMNLAVCDTQSND